jgi:hypothetical protein
VVNVAVERPARKVVGAAVALGLLAFAADSVEGMAGQIVITLVSSGFAWGTAALLTGRTAADRRRAVVDATVLLTSATLVYYLLILVVSRRWSGGTLFDGSPADWHGLRSVALMTAAWLVVSAVAGPSFGLLGHLTRTARTPVAALAAGAACGLLSGQAWQHFPAPWLPGAVLPLVVLAWLATLHRLWRAWPVLLGATVATTTLSALFWEGLRLAELRLAG